MNFEELGAILRTEREKRNYGIDDAANALKISARQIRALESGDMAALPHPAYARGFLRSYANWLGLGDNLQELVEQNQASAIKQQSALKPDHQEPAENEELILAPREVKRSSPKKSGGFYLFLLILCILGAAGWAAWRVNALELAQSLYAEYFEKKEPAQPLDTPEKKETEQPIEPEPVQKEPVAVALPPESAAPAEPASEPVAAQAGEEAIEEITPPPVEPAGPPSPHKLIITALEECWIHSNADKTESRQFSLRKGDTFALTFSESLELKLGNAGGVRLRYDGEDLPPPGTSGQVRTVTLPPAQN